MTRFGNPGAIKIVQDKRSKTGYSAAIVIRNIKPKQLNNGICKIAASRFYSGLKMNLLGYEVHPVVEVAITCALNQIQMDKIKRKQRADRALQFSPILK